MIQNYFKIGGIEVKREGTLKSILAILVIILICLVSFGGIYTKDKNVMKNVLPDYVLGMDLDTDTIIKLDVVKDEDSSSEGEDESADDDTKVEESSQDGQAENKYTIDNYKKSKEIIETRLKKSGVEQYTVRLDDGTGSIVLEVPENVETSVLQNIFVVGKTEINIKNNSSNTESTDEDDEASDSSEETASTSELIGDYKSIKKITASIDDSYAEYGMGSYVKLDLEFTSDAIKKFKEIQAGYEVPTDEEGNKNENNVEITIDGSTICSLTESEFLETAVNGNLPLKLGDYTTDDDELNETLVEANSIKTLIENGNLPITYSVNYNNDIHSNISVLGIVSVFAVILAVMLVYLVIKYKLKGILAELCIAGFGALLMLALRYTKVQISIASIVSVAGILILQFIYLVKLLNNNALNSKEFVKETIDFTKMIIPAFIIAIVAAVVPALENFGVIPGNILEISSFGMVVFWGLILFELFNNIVTRAIITNVKNK